MPIDIKRYPPDWKAISLRIRERDGWCCKWCGVQNGAVGARDRYGVWHDEHAIHHMNSGEGLDLFGDEFPSMVKIVLTVAHLGADYPDGRKGDKHDKLDVRDENLAALCQKCHLNFDRDEHTANRKRSHAAKRKAAVSDTGQLDLL